MVRRAKAPDWGELAEAPRADLPRPRAQRWADLRARFLVGMLLVMLPLFVVALGSAIATIRQAQSSPAASSTAGSPAVSAYAAAAVNAWLGSVPAPLPEGRILVVGDPRPAPVVAVSEENAGTARPTSSLVDVVVSSPAGMFTATVQVGTDPRGSLKVLAGPSLEPFAPAATDDWAGSTPWPGLSVTAPADPLVKAIQGWASAYTSGDPVTLRLAVGDTSGTAYYTPLVGVSSVASDVVAAAAVDATSSRVVARVELVLTWSGAPAAAAGSTPVPVVFDVLIERADTAAPLVTAWGAPGSGPALTRYANAVDGTARPTAIPTPSLSPSPSVTP